MIKWIFFDIGGTIVDDSVFENERVEVMEKIISEYRPVNKNEIEKIVPLASSRLGSMSKNIIDCFLGGENAKKALSAYRDTLKYEPARVVVREEAQDVIKKLASKYKLAFSANQPAGVKKVLEDAGIFQYFSHQKVSSDYLYAKPDPRFFKHILHDAGASAKESIVIDDNIERGLVSAKKIGMTTIWYKTTDRKDYPKSSVDYTITSLRDLLGIFEIK